MDFEINLFHNDKLKMFDRRAFSKLKSFIILIFEQCNIFNYTHLQRLFFENQQNIIIPILTSPIRKKKTPE